MVLEHNAWLMQIMGAPIVGRELESNGSLEDNWAFWWCKGRLYFLTVCIGCQTWLGFELPMKFGNLIVGCEFIRWYAWFDTWVKWHD